MFCQQKCCQLGLGWTDSGQSEGQLLGSHDSASRRRAGIVPLKMWAMLQDRDKRPLGHPEAAGVSPRQDGGAWSAEASWEARVLSTRLHLAWA